MMLQRLRRRATMRVLPLVLAASFGGRQSSSVSAFQLSLPTSRSSFSSDGCSLDRHIHTAIRIQGDVACHLFFRKTDNAPAPRRRKFNPDVLVSLQSASLLLPVEIAFEEAGGAEPREYEEKLSIRFMRQDDIRYIIPLCIDEFGTGSTLSILDFPLGDFSKLSNWWDRVYFEPSVRLALLAKINANLRISEGCRANDPAVLVLSRTRCRKGDDKALDEIVGIVELSLQPPDANRNPPPFPVPLWLKQLYCRLTGTKLQGWVTNLLVDPRCRGLGYSKILMLATEGVAKSWGCDYIYLHADADFRSGKVAQALYKGLGYQVVTDQSPEYAWMAGVAPDPFSSIRMIDGAPLLCFCKQI